MCLLALFSELVVPWLDWLVCHYPKRVWSGPLVSSVGKPAFEMGQLQPQTISGESALADDADAAHQIYSSM